MLGIVAAHRRGPLASGRKVRQHWYADEIMVKLHLAPLFFFWVGGGGGGVLGLGRGDLRCFFFGGHQLMGIRKGICWNNNSFELTPWICMLGFQGSRNLHKTPLSSWSIPSYVVLGYKILFFNTRKFATEIPQFIYPGERWDPQVGRKRMTRKW